MEYFREFHIRRFLLCVILLGVLLVAALLPWPTRIDTEMTCVEFSADGQELSEGTVHLQGWQLNYLFREDELRLEPFSLPNDPSVTIDPDTIVLTDAVCTFGNGEILGNFNFSSLSVVVGEKWKSCLLCLDGNRYFVCLEDQSASASEIFHNLRLFVS